MGCAPSSPTTESTSGVETASPASLQAGNPVVVAPAVENGMSLAPSQKNVNFGPSVIATKKPCSLPLRAQRKVDGNLFKSSIDPSTGGAASSRAMGTLQGSADGGNEGFLAGEDITANSPVLATFSTNLDGSRIEEPRTTSGVATPHTSLSCTMPFACA